MRGTALVVLLCVLAAIAAHVLTEEARARSVAAEEMCQPCDEESAGQCAFQDGFAPQATDASASVNAPADDAAATTQP